MVEGRFRLPGRAGCCLQTDIENDAPFSVKNCNLFTMLIVSVNERQ
jgi:hypothetical protein